MDIKDFISVASLGVNIFFFIYMRNIANRSASNNRIDAMRDEISTQMTSLDMRIHSSNERLTRAEVHIESSPSNEDLGRIYQRIESISISVASQQGELNGELKGIHRSLDAVLNTMLEREKKS